MKLSNFIFCVLCSFFCSFVAVAETAPASNTIKLPPTSVDVTDLTFNEFFKMPIGPQGLELTDKLLSLNNKRVRVVGYMAHEDDPTPGIFMLASRPVNVGEKADGMADDLPAATLYVHMPEKDAEKVLVYRAAPWVLTGRLELGNKEDINDRISYVRLVMEPQDLTEAKKLDKSLHKKIQPKKVASTQ